MKGCQKKVIFLKNTGSYLFDEAYFIISREGERTPLSEDSMIFEANRIIENNRDTGEEYRTKGGRFLSFLLPFVIGAVITSVLFVSFMSF